MKKSVQETNSLENFLVSAGKYLKENKDKCLQALLLILIAIAAVIFLRTYFYGRPQKFQQEFDQASAISSRQAMLTGLPSPVPYDALASRYTRGNHGAEIRINAAEAVLKIGQNEVQRKAAASKAGRAFAEVIAMNPESTFNDAIKRFESVASVHMATDPLLAARALYGLASSWENLASVTAGDDEVNVRLDTAKGSYQQIIDHYSETPFAEQAKGRVVALDEPMTREFYKKTAADYVAMPVPEEIEPESSILSESGDALDPDAAVQSEDFTLEEGTAEGFAPESSEPTAAEEPASGFSEPAAAEEPVLEFSEPVAAEEPASEFSEPVAAEEPASEFSEPVAAEEPASESFEPTAAGELVPDAPAEEVVPAEPE
ncbi:MAG: hypothetical protein ACOX6D_02330 [Thermoguttaceae bacterium]|jgi:hypothetical protein